jgi:glycerol-3-phosphate dehydrogenase
MNRDAICVLGAGSWGTALAIRLATNNNRTSLWGHEPAFMHTLAAERENRAFPFHLTSPSRKTLPRPFTRPGKY